MKLISPLFYVLVEKESEKLIKSFSVSGYPRFTKDYTYSLSISNSTYEDLILYLSASSINKNDFLLNHLIHGDQVFVINTQDKQSFNSVLEMFPKLRDTLEVKLVMLDDEHD